MTKNTNIPDIPEIMNILKKNNTPDRVIKHSGKVTDIALKLGRKLKDKGINVNLDMIKAAALLHDVSRVEENHALVGAEVIAAYGYPEISHIVSQHMTYNFSNQIENLTETDIVCIADRVVKEDQYVGFDARMTDVLKKFKDNPQAIKRISEKMKETKVFLTELEKFLDISIDEIAKDDSVHIEPLLSKVMKPGRYIGSEVNSIKKDLTDESIKTRFAFAFPDLYEIGMSYTGLQIIYNILNSIEDVYCERVFTPAKDMQELMKENHLPLFTLETHTDLNAMDIIGFTLQYELSFTNIIKMLQLANIPPRRDDRQEFHPIICAGGPCAVNPAPIEDAIDFFMIGDGEEILPEVCQLHKEWKADPHRKKEDFLKKVSKIPGIYVPFIHNPSNPVKKRIVSDLNKADFPAKPIVPIIESVHDRSIVEVFRGCSRGCRFCQAGIIYRPVRERSVENIKEIASNSIKNTGYDELSLLSLATNDYSEIDLLIPELLDICGNKNVSLSLPSLRLDSFSIKTLEKIQTYKKTGLTFAPEAGTQRLRNVINKTISDDEIYFAVKNAAELGWKRMKFYFMIGLPTETFEDLDGIVDTAIKSIETARDINKRNFSLTVSVSNFVPKPHTPFQWFTPNDEEEFKEKNFYLKEKFSKQKNISFQYHDTRTSWIEILLARGGKETYKAIEKAVDLGAGFDSWTEDFNFEIWEQAYEEVGLNFRELRSFGFEDQLPWDMIDIGVSKSFLKKEWDRALGEKTTPDCRTVCYNCGLDCNK